VQTHDLDALRIELEKLRIDLEKAKLENELTRTYLDRWRTDVQPIHEHQLMSREQGYGLARLGVQTAFLLNGGALIAFPAFAKLADTPLQSHVGFSSASIGCFVVGLVMAAVSMLTGAFAFGADADAVEQKANVVKAGVTLLHSQEAQRSAIEARRNAAEAERTRLFERARKLGRWAIGAAVGGVVAFVFGAFFAAQVIQ
jgi:hypothetical protein